MGIRDEMYREDWTPAETMEKDAGGRLLDEVKAVLADSKNGYKAQLDRGVSPDEFKKGSALLAAYDAAAVGLDKAWKGGRKT